MISIQRISPVARAIAVIGAVMALVTGVTFATLQNTATLTGNTISSDADGLLVDSDGNNTFGATDEGFAFSDVEPGTSSSYHAFKLKNATDESMVVNVQVTGESALPVGVDASDITFIFDLPGGDSEDASATWAQIIAEDGINLFNDLGANVVADLAVKVHIDSSVSDDVSISPFNFTFGTPDSVVEE